MREIVRNHIDIARSGVESCFGELHYPLDQLLGWNAEHIGRAVMNGTGQALSILIHVTEFNNINVLCVHLLNMQRLIWCRMTRWLWLMMQTTENVRMSIPWT